MAETAAQGESAADPRFRFLSSIIGRPVRGLDGARLGRLTDLVVATGEPYPLVESLVLTGREGRRSYPWSSVERFGDGGLTLKADAVASTPPDQPLSDRIPLVEEILDKQIVDVHDAKLVRVNDLHFLELKGQLRIAHVDVGLRGLVRRMGWERLVDKALKLVRPGAPYLKADQLVSWKLVQPLDQSAGKVRLEVAQRLLATLHPADLAEIMEDLGRDQRTVLLERLDVETAAEALEEASPELAAQLLEEVAPEKAADILEEMAPDEAADVLSDLPGETRDEVLAAMERPEAREVEALLGYEQDSAGGLMTPDRLQLAPEQTVADAISELRRRDEELPLVYEIFVADEGGHLLGICTLRDLVLNAPGTRLGTIMREAPATLGVHDRLRDVAAAAAKYNLVSVAVVDEAGVMQGMVTVDDILGEVVDGR
jgi:CBS domain-containing protein/sporulation protein YlmC with PRC-barrel domain